MDAIAQEGGHWYGRDGSPQYEVASASGEMRPTTVRDARKLGLLPSVTAIIRCAASPGLDLWRRKQVMLASLTLPRLAGEADDDFCTRVMRDADAQGRQARERGQLIHGAIERHFLGLSPREEYWDAVKAVAAAVREFAGERAWNAEKSFASALGYGGKVDLHGDGFIVDFKTKEFGPDTKLAVYDEQAMQLAAYREGLRMPVARCANVYVSSTHPGLVQIVEHEQGALERAWKMFFALLTYWQHKNYCHTGSKETT